MAERRMFAKSITNSAKFLRMPATARLLYYDLGMAADDDGVVEAFTVLRITGTTEEDLELLAERGFVTILNEDLVTYINSWKQNNQIRANRYRTSVYADLLAKALGEEETVQPNDSQSAATVQPSDSQSAAIVQPSDSQSAAQVRLGKDSIGKDSLGKVSTGKVSTGKISTEQVREGQERGYEGPGGPTRTHFTPPGLEDVAEYCAQLGLYHVDPGRFVDYYTSNGWMVGKAKMKDWQAAVRNWSSRELEQSRPKKSKAAQELDEFYKMAAAFAEREDLQ